MFKNNKVLYILTAAVLTVCYPAIPAVAGLEQLMENSFNAEINVTEPGAYLGARRGAITFGKVRIANQISKPQLVNFTPPGYKVGCGGLDVWGGAFSFISGKQLEAHAKNIASSAAAYAFELALSKFPDGKHAIGQMRDITNKINKFSLDSCQAGRQLGESLFGKIKQPEEEMKNAASNIAVHNGGVRDNFSGWFGSSGMLEKVSAGELKEAGFRVNPLWSALSEGNAAAWYAMPGDTDFLELLMSISGTTTFVKGQKDKEGRETITPSVRPSTLTVDNLVHGGSITLIKCNEIIDCESVMTSDVTLVGLNTRILKSLIGDATQVGIIDKFHNGTVPFTDGEKQLLGALSPNIGGMINALSSDPGVAKQFIKDASTMIAYTIGCRLVNDVFNNIELVLRAKQWSGQGAVLAQVASARTAQSKQCEDADKGASNLNKMMQIYAGLMAQIKGKI